MPKIETRPLERFGVEILGVNLAHEHDQDTIDAIRKIWAENGVVLFREQQLEELEIVRFSAYFGRLEIHVREEYLSMEHPELLLVSNIQRDGQPIGILSDHAVGWHHDQIYLPRPALGSLLHSVKIPSSGGNTCFANLADAYDALPAKKQRYLEPLRAIHSYEYFNRRWSEPTSDQQKDRTPNVTHPLIRTHPETGRKAIYADPGMTPAIEGLEAHQSRALLDELFDWCTQSRFIYEHEWRLGDALMWDNATTMHRRGEFDPSTERLMKRTTILPPADRAVPF